MLTVSQLALATMLLVGAGLLIHSFVNLSRVDLGYSPASVLTFELVTSSFERTTGLERELDAEFRQTGSRSDPAC